MTKGKWSEDGGEGGRSPESRFDDVGLHRVECFMRLGATIERLAKYFGVSKATVYCCMASDPTP